MLSYGLRQRNGGFLRKTLFGTLLVNLLGMEVHKVQGSSKMVNFTRFNRIATAAVGAIVISSACIAAATGPGMSVQQTEAFAAVKAPVPVQAVA